MGTRAKSLTTKQPTRRTFATREQSEQYHAKQRFYASRAWRTLREQKLHANPLCEECLKHDRLEPTVDIDHHLPRDERPDLSLAWENLTSLCKSCHARKTRQEHSGTPRGR